MERTIEKGSSNGGTCRSLMSIFRRSRPAQAASTQPRPLVEVITSLVFTIPHGLVNFDYQERGERFGYEFTRHFGDAVCERHALSMKVHVVMMAFRGSTAVD